MSAASPPAAVEAMWRLSGQLCSRRDLAAQNASWWYVAVGAKPIQPGWGDLSFADLDTVAAHTSEEEAVAVVPERPTLYMRAERRRPTPKDLTKYAEFILHAGGLRFVDHWDRANRLGAVWLQRGYRYTITGHPRYSTGRVRLLTLKPHELLALPPFAPSELSPKRPRADHRTDETA